MRIHLGHMLALGLVMGLGPNADTSPNPLVPHPRGLLADERAPEEAGNVADATAREAREPARAAGRFARASGPPAGGLSGTGVVRSDGDRYQFGGRVALPEVPDARPAGQWTHHQQHGSAGHFIFESGGVPGTGIRRVDFGASRAGVAATQAPRRAHFAGVGTFRHVRSASPQLAPIVAGATHHWFEVEVDANDPGTARNHYRITIYAGFAPGERPNTRDVIFTVGGRTDGGGVRISPPVAR